MQQPYPSPKTYINNRYSLSHPIANPHAGGGPDARPPGRSNLRPYSTNTSFSPVNNSSNPGRMYYLGAGVRRQSLSFMRWLDKLSSFRPIFPSLPETNIPTKSEKSE